MLFQQWAINCKCDLNVTMYFARSVRLILPTAKKICSLGERRVFRETSRRKVFKERLESFVCFPHKGWIKVAAVLKHYSVQLETITRNKAFSQLWSNRKLVVVSNSNDTPVPVISVTLGTKLRFQGLERHWAQRRTEAAERHEVHLLTRRRRPLVQAVHRDCIHEAVITLQQQRCRTRRDHLAVGRTKEAEIKHSYAQRKLENMVVLIFSCLQRNGRRNKSSSESFDLIH
ncbi:hypothetical protein M514_06304 [Trichuris suis]|uniref:Uncharacterized protein n=1 Tax=Trichuris suis TaxID=68888 RepID=A0A085M6G7_9BILA|nr:hypothetical protein M513_06304 [Trichuris suis]KFD64944.1 hypothetical protein M514_06304 [Trichuris suis]